MSRVRVDVTLGLAKDSFLRRADPRTKLTLALAVSTAVALPLAPLMLICTCFMVLLAVGGLVQPAAAHLWRKRWWFAVLFVLDCSFVGLAFAAVITLRLSLLTSAFILVFATTTPDELRLACERFGFSQRLAFAFATAFRSLALLEREWQGIIEAQRARGIAVTTSETRRGRLRRADLAGAAALIVPAVVLATQRAWSISEAAAARGFESPHRLPYRALRLRALDHALLAATVVVLGSSLFLR